MWLKLVCVLGALILLRTNTKLGLPLSLEVGFLEGEPRAESGAGHKQLPIPGELEKRVLGVWLPE